MPVELLPSRPPSRVCQVDLPKDRANGARAGSGWASLPPPDAGGQALGIAIPVVIPVPRASRGSFAWRVVFQNHRIKRCHTFNTHLVGTFRAPEVGVPRLSLGDLERI